MRTLSALSIAAAFCLVIPSVQAADEKPARGARTSEARVKEMTEQLGLSAEQQGKIKAILDQNMPKAKEIRENASLSAEDKRAKMQELRKAESSEIRAVLTPEQQEKMKELRSRQRAAGEGAKPKKQK